MIPEDLYYEISLKLESEDLLAFLETIQSSFNILYMYDRLKNDFGVALDAEDYYAELLDPKDIYKVLCTIKDHNQRIDYAMTNCYYSLLVDLLSFPIAIEFKDCQEHLLYKSVVLNNDIISTELVCTYVEDFSTIELELLELITHNIILVDQNVNMYLLMEDIFSQSEDEETYKHFKHSLHLYVENYELSFELLEAIYDKNKSLFDLSPTITPFITL